MHPSTANAPGAFLKMMEQIGADDADVHAIAVEYRQVLGAKAASAKTPWNDRLLFARTVVLDRVWPRKLLRRFVEDGRLSAALVRGPTKSGKPISAELVRRVAHPEPTDNELDFAMTLLDKPAGSLPIGSDRAEVAARPRGWSRFRASTPTSSWTPAPTSSCFSPPTESH